MRIFISWSGEASKKIAIGLQNFLEQVIQNVDIYLTSRDITGGERWQSSINENLEESNYGILCLNSDNLDSRWILYEAGALGKSLGAAHVVPLLFELKPADVAPPISQFQMKNCDSDGISSLVRDINETNEQRVKTEVLEKSIAAFLPDLTGLFDNVREQLSRVAPPKRSDRELLEEVLSEVRHRPDKHWKNYVLHGRDLARLAGELRAIGGADLQIIGSSSKRKMKILVPKELEPSLKCAMLEAANSANIRLQFEIDNFEQLDFE